MVCYMSYAGVIIMKNKLSVENRVSQNACGAIHPRERLKRFELYYGCVCQWLMWLNWERHLPNTVSVFNMVFVSHFLWWGKNNWVCMILVWWAREEMMRLHWKNSLVKCHTDILQKTQCNFWKPGTLFL